MRRAHARPRSRLVIAAMLGVSLLVGSWAPADTPPRAVDAATELVPDLAVAPLATSESRWSTDAGCSDSRR